MFLSELAKLIFGSARNGTDGRSNYRGVEVHAGTLGCCAAVHEIRGKRFLSDEVPSLPLPGCNAEDCGCTYELFADRRRSPGHDRRLVNKCASVDSDTESDDRARGGSRAA